MALTRTKLPIVVRPAMMSEAASPMMIVIPTVKIAAWPALSTASDV